MLVLEAGLSSREQAGCWRSRLDHGLKVKLPKRAKEFQNTRKHIQKHAKHANLFQNDENGRNSANTHPNPAFLTGNSMPRPGEGLGHGPGPKKCPKICKISLFGPFFGWGLTCAHIMWKNGRKKYLKNRWIFAFLGFLYRKS